MSEVLEWFQCKACGRRHRWRADIAGTRVRCQCGDMVFCPEIDMSAAAGNLGDTLVETVDSPTARSPSDAFGGHSTMDSPAVKIRHRGDGPFGLTTNGQFVLWTIMSLLGLSMVIHAVITRFPWYIALAVILAPISFWKWNRIRRRWQRGRPFMRALNDFFEEIG